MTLLRDLRYALRILARNRLFAAAALIAIALGVGITTAVFTVVRGVLLRPLPYPYATRLVALRVDSSRGVGQPILTTQELLALRARTDLFAEIASLRGVDANLTGPDGMDIVPAASVSDNLFRTLGVTPLLGRELSIQRDM